VLEFTSTLADDRLCSQKCFYQWCSALQIEASNRETWQHGFRPSSQVDVGKQVLRDWEL